MDGKHHIEILKDLAGSQHDLVVIGALGIGRARDSVIGSVCERVARQSRPRRLGRQARARSRARRSATRSWSASTAARSRSARCMTAIELAHTLRQEGRGHRRLRPLPALLGLQRHRQRPHRAGGQGLPLRGAEPAPRGDHRHRPRADLPVAPRGRRADGAARRASRSRRRCSTASPSRRSSTTRARPIPGCIVVGRIGVHSPKDETGLGSNTENLLRAAPCDVLLSTRARGPAPRRARRGDHPLDARGRGAHDARARAGQGHRPHRRPAPGAREGALGDHERGDRRGDGPVHAEERLGRDQGAGRGAWRSSGRRPARCRCAGPAASRPRRAAPVQVHRLRRHRLRGDLRRR